MNVYQIAKPWQSNQERLVSESLAASQTPGAILAEIPPPLPQVHDRPRFGWPDVNERTPTIEQVLDIDRLYGDAREAISGGPAGYQGSARNIQESIG